MKRRLLMLFPIVLMVLTMAVPVSADIIWEPDDTFYEAHSDECVYVGRRYQLAGYGGTVTLFRAPGGMEKTTLDNGMECTVQFLWTGKGIEWGYLMCGLDGGLQEGWAPMDDLSLVYDSQQFRADHAGEIQETTVQVDFQEAVLYHYPNGTVTETLKEDAGYSTFSDAVTELYTDENGLRWGYIGYYKWVREKWICLDDPMNGERNDGIVPAAPSAAQLRGSVTVRGGVPALPLAAALVAAVMAVTAVLLLRRPKRS